MRGEVSRRSFTRALATGGVMLLLLVSCAGPDTSPDFPQAPSPEASRFTVTPPGGLPFDVYLSKWGQGYVIHAEGRPPIFLVPDRDGGYIAQRAGDTASFVVPRRDGSGWDILSARGRATSLRRDGGGWVLQTAGDPPI